MARHFRKIIHKAYATALSKDDLTQSLKYVSKPDADLQGYDKNMKRPCWATKDMEQTESGQETPIMH